LGTVLLEVGGARNGNLIGRAGCWGGSGKLERACGRAGLVTLGEAGSEGGLGSVGRELGVTEMGTLLPRPFGGGFVEFGSGGCEGRIVAICMTGTEV
jgi:hypothetical protein